MRKPPLTFKKRLFCDILERYLNCKSQQESWFMEQGRSLEIATANTKMDGSIPINHRRKEARLPLRESKSLLLKDNETGSY